MNIRELINNTWTSRAERSVLDSMHAEACPISYYEENDQFIIEQLIRKSLVIKQEQNGIVYVKPNDQY
jgi:hypothetical protein